MIYKPETWLKRQKRQWKFMSFNNKWRLGKCLFGFHEPMPSYYSPGCWVCGKLCFIKEHNEWIANLNKSFGYEKYKLYRK